MLKVCTNCNEPKEATTDNFSPSTPPRKGLRSQCRQCRSEAARQWQKDNPERARQAQKARYDANPEAQKAKSRAYYQAHREERKAYLTDWRSKNKGYFRQHRYNMSPSDYEALLSLQGHACAICRDSSKPLHVDHCHTHGHVRGLLCFNCNTAIGKLGDNITHLQSAITYLQLTSRGG